MKPLHSAAPPPPPSCGTHHFLSGAQDTHLAEADVEGRALQRAIGRAHHDDVDAAGERGRVDAAVQLLHLHEHLARQLSHVVHGLRLQPDRQPERERRVSVYPQTTVYTDRY